MAKKGKRTGVGVAVMYSFARSMNFRASDTKTSPYVWCSKLLDQAGQKRSDGETARNHCIRCESFIREKAKGHHKKTVTKNSAGSFYQPSVSAQLTVAGVSVTSDAFLSTYEWKRVRMMALKKYGPVCQCCGASPSTGAVMNVDHIKPRKLFPQLALDLDNLQVLCGDCNHGKGNWDMTDWREQEDPPELIRHIRDICG